MLVVIRATSHSGLRSSCSGSMKRGPWGQAVHTPKHSREAGNLNGSGRVHTTERPNVNHSVQEKSAQEFVLLFL